MVSLPYGLPIVYLNQFINDDLFLTEVRAWLILLHFGNDLVYRWATLFPYFTKRLYHLVFHSVDVWDQLGSLPRL